MRQILLTLLFLLIGLTLGQGVKYLYHLQNTTTSPKAVSSTKFSLEKAPSQSLQGQVASISGTVLWLSRTASKPNLLKKSQNLQQGEELSTDKNSFVDILIKNFASLSLAPNSHINFIQLLPINLVFVQDRGAVMYQASGRGAISVRSFDLLSILNKGAMVISIDKDAHTITIEAVKGIIQESGAIKIEQGQRYIFDYVSKQGIIKGTAITNPSFLQH